MQAEQPEQWFCNHSSMFPSVLYIVGTSACYEEAAGISPCENVSHRGHNLLLGVAEQAEIGRDPREKFNLARFKLKFRLSYYTPCFPRHLSNLSVSLKIILTNWRNGLEEIRCNLIEISIGFYV